MTSRRSSANRRGAAGDGYCLRAPSLAAKRSARNGSIACRVSPVSAADVDAAWWTRLTDPLLNELIDTAISANRDLGEAAARLREARATRDAVTGRSLPQLSIAAAATQNRLSENGALPVGRVPGLGPDSRHLVLSCPHPSPLSARSGFFGCRHFSRANAFLGAHGRGAIDWRL